MFFNGGSLGKALRERQFQFGAWLVDREACLIMQEDGPRQIRIEPRAMDVLVALCTHAGNILSADDLLRLCWDTILAGENQVHKAVAQLRRAFDDSANQPRYIENIRKRGYRTIAPVTPVPGSTGPPVLGDWSEGSPFVGLDPFDAAHARVFFGRDAAIASLKDAVVRQVAGGHALVLVLGPSGSGKTSLVMAGLLPALRDAIQPFALLDSTTLDLGDIGGVPLATAIGGALRTLDGLLFLLVCRHREGW